MTIETESPPPTAAPEAGPGQGPELERVMSLLEHLDELRSTLVRVAIVAVILVGAAWAFSDRLLDALLVRLIGNQKALALTPGEAFNARMQVALWTGGLIAVPYVLLEAWRFVAPGLKKNERKFAMPWMVASGLLLYAGIAFAVELLLPAMVGMLQSFATPRIEARVSVGSLLSFAVKLAAGCGLLFQMPLVLCLLAWFGIVSPRALWRAWRHAVFFIALGAAIITPGDGPSMLILTAPLVVLYFMSVGVAWALWRARGRPARDRGLFA
ncbi:MAG TPA: twin-arginine translocase subunit TatC [Candidatus Limnocylindrales bacterium]|nr:twin-arginine translocase subunit TatC [Candidatus Limnocylindrales bacterium]